MKEELVNSKATQWRDMHNRMQAKRSIRKINTTPIKPRMGRDDEFLFVRDNLATVWLCSCVAFVSVSCAGACIRLSIISRLRRFKETSLVVSDNYSLSLMRATLSFPLNEMK